MKAILGNTWTILTPGEKRRVILFALGDVVVSVLDVVVLAKLLIMVSQFTYSGEIFIGPAVPVELHPLQDVSIILALFIGKNLAAYLLHKFKFEFVYRVAARISENNLLQYLEGNYHEYTGTDSSVHIRKVSQQPVEFSHYVLSGFQQLFSEGIMVALVVAAIIYYDAVLFGLLCLVLLPPLVGVAWYVKRKTSSVRKNIKTSSEQALQHLKEALAGYVESNIYATHDFFTERYATQQQKLNRYLASLQTMQVLPGRLMEIFAVVGLVTLLVLSQYTSPEFIDNLTIGAFLVAAYKIIPGMVKVVNLSSQIRTYSFAAENLAKEKTEKLERTKPGSLTSIAANDISFSFADKKILQQFNFELKQGDIAGLSSYSGRGKTTFINLLLGFLEPATGDISFNNTSLNAAQRKTYWKNISYVKQQPFLLHDTILTNITLSAQEHDEQQLQYALKVSGLDALIDTWPDGLDTAITENGKNISGGQRQRIAFARALYKNADLLILDEPFNELDDAATQEALQQLQVLAKQKKMILLITHDKKTLSFCNKVTSLDEG
jgi:ABC-type multidrug transport system fused ATPase/permease subunit